MPSFLYKPLTDGELNAVITQSLHTGIASSRLLTGGMFNTTYFIESTEGKKYVLRVGPVNRHLLVPYEHRLMEAEAHFYSLCKEKNIPVSNVVVCDTSKSIIDRDFMIVDFIESETLFAVPMDDKRMEKLAYEIGIEAAKMHGITGFGNSAPKFGRVAELADSPDKGFERWSDFLWDELMNWESVALPAQMFTPEEHETIRRIFSKEAPILDEITTPGLLHNDFWHANILIRFEGETPKLAAFIDADRCFFGDPDFENISLRWMLDCPSYWEGYGKPLATDDHAVRRRHLYNILTYLWHAYVFKCEYDNIPEMHDRCRRVREAMQNLL